MAKKRSASGDKTGSKDPDKDPVEGLICEHCERVFKTPQGLATHKKRCSPTPKEENLKDQELEEKEQIEDDDGLKVQMENEIRRFRQRFIRQDRAKPTVEDTTAPGPPPGWAARERSDLDRPDESGARPRVSSVPKAAHPGWKPPSAQVHARVRSTDPGRREGPQVEILPQKETDVQETQWEDVPPRDMQSPPQTVY